MFVRRFGLGVYTLALACSPLAALAADPTPAENPKPVPAPATATANAEGAVVYDTPGIPSEFWLGVECFPVSPALRSQLRLEENVGLMIEAVLPDSPAAKAPLKQYDILLMADEMKLSDLVQLGQALDKQKDKALKFTLLRSGEKTTVEVTPARRPNRDLLIKSSAFIGPPGQPLHMQFFHPGMILPAGAAPQVELPKNLSISISKSGAEPSKIEVNDSGKTYSANENELDKLPKEIRPHVETMLGRGVAAQNFAFGHPVGEPMTIKWNSIAPPVPPPAAQSQAIERQIQAIDRQMEQIRAELKRLQLQPQAPDEDPQPTNGKP